MSDIAIEDALVNYIQHDVYGALQGGVAVLDLGGAPVAQLRPEAGVVPDFTTPSNRRSRPAPTTPDRSGAPRRTTARGLRARPAR
ncbi:hypothetical protein OV203_12510 [Nannocystis sp. ILAH1]|nr:hypothetical protein [Nannocystis sp. ILAH1]MCY0987953.1 hypothetical protein [Nannocystis sp. ILAH1]